MQLYMGDARYKSGADDPHFKSEEMSPLFAAAARDEFHQMNGPMSIDGPSVGLYLREVFENNCDRSFSINQK